MNTAHVNQRTRVPSAKLPAVMAFSVWTLTAAAGTAWVLAAWPVDPTSVTTVAMAPPTSATQPGKSQADWAKVLGQQAEPAEKETNHTVPSGLVLLGMAHAAGSKPVALMAMEGQAVKQVRPGEEVQPGLWLQSVSLSEVRLGGSVQGPATLVLPMPKRPSANTAEK